MSGRAATAFVWGLIGGIALAGCSPGARGNAQTVVGTVERVDASARTLSVRDAAGGIRNFTVDGDAGIDLGTLRAGDPVSVALARSTPPNMVSAADRLRKGDILRKRFSEVDRAADGPPPPGNRR